VLVVIRGPVYNMILQRKQKDWAAANQQEWQSIKNQMYLSREAAKTRLVSRDADKMEEVQNSYGIKVNTAASQPISIDINSASIEEWASIKGIGPVLSERIVKYRNKLGGFHSLVQVKEVYGISDSLYIAIKPLLKLNKVNLRFINPNTDDFEVLAGHPYISNTLAKQMIGYRTKVAPFEKIDDLKKLYNMNDTLYQRLYPYLTLAK
jgi:competence ComEA-like helix-hairpin-helix protein